MNSLIRIHRRIWREERKALRRGLALSVAVLVAGAALLGLSGWFITAAGMAGIAGLGIAFDVFRPSAGVRFLALGRTAARYGERLLTHDATLRVLARLRVRILEGLAGEDPVRLARLRSPLLLNRVTADVDALDGVAIRVVIPVVAGAMTLAFAGMVLAWLVPPVIAALSVGILAAGGALTIGWSGRRSVAPAAEAERLRQAFRAAAIEHFRARIVHAFAGTLPRSRERLLEIDKRLRDAELRLARLDRQGVAAVSATGLVAAGATLAAGGVLVLSARISPADAAIAVFASLALTEVLAPLQRVMGEFGRMRDAAGRVAPLLDGGLREHASPDMTPGPSGGRRSLLSVSGLSVGAPVSTRPLMPPLTFAVESGEMLALAGRSGSGKTTLLSTIAGMVPTLGGTVAVTGTPLASCDEAFLRGMLGYLPQRSQLMSGTVRGNLGLAAPLATEDDMMEMIGALGLGAALDGRGGLDLALGEGGAGLSGGESRRLALARVLLRRPRILLLDEPTEGLDADTAAMVLAAARRFLPDAAILLASHKASEIEACDRVLTLKDIN
ncbi:MAG: ATP-binding cassette domain-containing protein [Geminicoccaceae bacterium]|nr:ATP-binding cassette domain-containing protein [Geminicoccaceae bacterium]